MNKGAIVLSAVALVAGIAGCSAPPAALGSTTALVTVDGKDAGTKRAIDCQQIGDYWMIETLEKTPGFSATFRTREKLTADSVDIRDLAGFTGSMWTGSSGTGAIGNATIELVGTDYLITGEANGAPTDNPTKDSTVKFEIKASC